MLVFLEGLDFRFPLGIHASNKYFLFALRKTGKPRKGKKALVPELINKGMVKYSAQKLYDKGVVLEIEGLPTSQYVASTSALKCNPD